jgi:hypothetical protein
VCDLSTGRARGPCVRPACEHTRSPQYLRLTSARRAGVRGVSSGSAGPAVRRASSGARAARAAGSRAASARRRAARASCPVFAPFSLKFLCARRAAYTPPRAAGATDATRVTAGRRPGDRQRHPDDPGPPTSSAHGAWTQYIHISPQRQKTFPPIRAANNARRCATTVNPVVLRRGCSPLRVDPGGAACGRPGSAKLRRPYVIDHILLIRTVERAIRAVRLSTWPSPRQRQLVSSAANPYRSA